MSPKRRSRKGQTSVFVILIGIALVVWYTGNIPGVPGPDTIIPGLGNSIKTLVPNIPVTGVTSTPGTSASVPSDLAPYMPDPNLTPGDVFDVTASDICVSGYSAKVRDVPQSLKDQVFAEYGITSHAPNSYEVDHLISLELGGSNSIKNLWPESYSGDWNAHVKDKLENRMHSLVCDGSLDLATAQHEEAANWIAAYKKYVGEP